MYNNNNINTNYNNNNNNNNNNNCYKNNKMKRKNALMTCSRPSKISVVFISRH